MRDSAEVIWWHLSFPPRCPCGRSGEKHSARRTAGGKRIRANGAMFVAAGAGLLSFHTRLSVPGYYQGVPVPVYDRGGRIKGRRLDVFFHSHAEAKRWGARWLDVSVYLD